MRRLAALPEGAMLRRRSTTVTVDTPNDPPGHRFRGRSIPALMATVVVLATSGTTPVTAAPPICLPDAVPPGGVLAQAQRKVAGGGAILGVGPAEGKFTLNVFESLTGKVDYRDVGAAIDFRSTEISSVTFDDGFHSVTIRGTGLNNGAQVDFTVVATDNEESGTNDELAIALGTGYSNSGNLIRGNIKIH